MCVSVFIQCICVLCMFECGVCADVFILCLFVCAFVCMWLCMFRMHVCVFVCVCVRLYACVYACLKCWCVHACVGGGGGGECVVSARVHVWDVCAYVCRRMGVGTLPVHANELNGLSSLLCITD